ncbi:probable dolichyl-diphosphooligosaccharide--protein glycosyltransferase subunit 3B [Corylus avellana]|uniref:probable dolichyl-diphosphooligosaccharide--protein glycosyltransferase subunit 3B n=1 Tax=Corylus avellana TaxID=13451 RepID=UPI001E21E8E9|nr:probable dolichyl-diphosphooligosaccharide--protein glycosyltransferase subunit 3B [Corylus avellana]XP_059439146.1 probable dolichyl-diphosphooligosaccharide--protein glycosyltransferase subunit 3B [Corylus avellana]XP_059439147.1 probable dolichyl-diphosphooligosaccharide--protein glycosyltransferase subunit 3B [Corylus avellana]XP_059439148.1 probable dolichyl-diphosphooligosaccharide--protein glycosyltransferase subunit 3B [Corylus avellana]
MAPRLFLLIAVFSLTLFSVSVRSSDSDLVSELLALQSDSKSGVIHLDDHSVSRFLTSPKTPRPYSLFVFFDVAQLHDKAELQLKTLHAEFSLLAKSFITNNQDPDSSSHGKLFFCDLEFKESQSTFALFGVNSLPHISLIGPNQTPKQSDQMDQGDFSRIAESMSHFVESKTNLVVGPIHRPPFLSKKQLALVIVGILIWIPFAVKKIVMGETPLHDPKLWLVGSVFVYFFSVSGAMHNIIRKMPMFLADRNVPNKLVFFYQGSGVQLGAEGFAVGFLYTIVGLLLAFMTRVLVKVKNVNVQMAVMIVSLFVSFWAVKKVVYLDNWKTGYGIHGFWPPSW